MLANWFGTRAEKRKATRDQLDRRESRTREQIAAVATAISAMLLELQPHFDAYADGVDIEKIRAMERATSIARKFRFDTMGKVQLLDDSLLRRQGAGVFEKYEQITGELADSIANHTQDPDINELDIARHSFFARARELVAAL